MPAAALVAAKAVPAAAQEAAAAAAAAEAAAAEEEEAFDVVFKHAGKLGVSFTPTGSVRAVSGMAESLAKAEPRLRGGCTLVRVQGVGVGAADWLELFKAKVKRRPLTLSFAPAAPEPAAEPAAEPAVAAGAASETAAAAAAAAAAKEALAVPGAPFAGLAELGWLFVHFAGEQLRCAVLADQGAGALVPRAAWSQFMGELTAQVGISNCKTWYENEFQVSYETWPQTPSFSYQVLRSSLLENSEIPT